MNIFTMMFLLACAANPAVISHTLLSDSSIDEIHHRWMIKYGRTCANTSEMEKRRAIFKENLEFIEERNTINWAAGKNYTLGLNDFSDLTIKELSSSCCGIMDIPSDLSSSKTIFFNMTVEDIPESVDWRNQRVVTFVKQQGTCGFFWAFATIAAPEGLWQIRKGEMISLSVQHLVDCDLGNKGCSYGYLNNAFKFATTTHNGAIPFEDSYPVKGIQQTCNNDIVASAGFNAYQLVTPGDEQQLLQVVAQQPEPVTIVVGHPEFFAFMGDGIYSGPCGPTVKHAVTIVGYDTIVNGQKYWIIKNSWGTNLVHLGYMKLLRGIESPKSLCDITVSYSYYPTVKNSNIQYFYNIGLM